MNPSDPGYYTAGRKVVVDWPLEDPAPLVTTLDPIPAGTDGPRKPFLDLQRFAEKNGWEVKAGYSLGQARGVRKGLYKTVHTWGLWGRGYGWRWCAMYAWSPDLKAAWAWDGTAIWRPGQLVAPGLGTRFVSANVTDLREWLSLNGSTGNAWFKGVHARVTEQQERQKAKAKERPATSKTKEGAS